MWFNLGSTLMRAAAAITRITVLRRLLRRVLVNGRVKMIRAMLSAAAALALATTATAATKPATKAAATKPVQCKDAKGKFIKCPAPVANAVKKSAVAVVDKPATPAGKAAAKSKPCRDAKGRFKKC